MRFIHLSDLHIGKKLHKYDLRDDQIHILREILRIIDETDPDAILIAGDIYDKSNPNTEDIPLWDDFLLSLANKGKEIFVISGNHDSATRFSQYNRLLRDGIHLAPVYNGNVKPVTIKGKDGSEACIYMLPFVKPSTVRSCFPEVEDKIRSFDAAMRLAVDKMNIDTSRCNILLAHQSVTGSECSGSEEMMIGGSEAVSCDIFKDFDYVALGHIHGPQNVTPRIRYCGTPLMYSFDEIKFFENIDEDSGRCRTNSVTVVDINGKEEPAITEVELHPLHPMRNIRGTFEELMRGPASDDYIRAILTDEIEIPNVGEKLRTVYRNFMTHRYENTSTAHEEEYSLVDEEAEEKTPLEYFSDFYLEMHGRELDKEQTAYMQGIMEALAGGGNNETGQA